MKVFATGEMSRSDIQPDGEHYEWAEMIRKAAREIQRRTRNVLRFQEMRPFDVYQGPYASTTLGSLWSTENQDEFYLDYGDGITGTPQEIAEVIRAQKVSSINRELVAGELVAVAEMLASDDAVSELRELVSDAFDTFTDNNYMPPNSKLKNWLNRAERALAKTRNVAATEMLAAIPSMTMGDVLDFKNRNQGPDFSRLGRMFLSEIAGIVYDDWKNVNYAAKPYLDAMATLKDINDMYIQDSGSSIVAYFLSNATSWHGEVAKTVKKELNRRLKATY